MTVVASFAVFETSHGPSWLQRYRLPKAMPPAEDIVKATLAEREWTGVAKRTGVAIFLLVALIPVTVCQSVLLRSEPAHVRFKAAFRATWRPDHAELRRADPLAIVGCTPLARRSAPLVLARPGP